MRLGVVFPQTEIGADPAVVRDYAQAAESLGYDHLLAYDHVLGANPEGRGMPWPGPYTQRHMFHEPLVLFGYLAGATRRLELAAGILILPQRQTALVAKQAAEVDVLSGGRLRLGVGIGWNFVEYEALGQNFHDRGRRIEEQIAVLRALWTQALVTFHGRWHRITAAGINPLPVQRPIPVWMGGQSDAVIRRVGRLADGWIVAGRPAAAAAPRRQRFFEDAAAAVARIREAAGAAGRDPNAIGIEVRVGVADATPDDWARAAEDARRLGATHLSVNTADAGLTLPAAHIEAIRRFKETVPC